MVQHTVAHRCLVNPPQFGVMDPKAFVWAVPIDFAPQIAMKPKNMCLDVACECCHIGLIAFVSFENIPCAKKILYRNY